ncbi:hypothetical protein NEF87_004335 [Candidatus Lokiarchaeum ossiferum]|uniref:BioF2-like acetyltransferase domain-containing protein n=1 Tax=Candidatus Lokiarchaeum ossiferum TaxID=2951803 RepID=A0ABY6HXA8_9ARCH|nr:hypothetical protein NEF87_004335 [Candidatus Lokiarchaeum sp. B-35]
MQILNTKSSWNEVLKKKFPKFNDIYFCYEYFQIYSENYNGVPEAIYWADSNVEIFWTHIVRGIDHLNLNKNYEFFDLTTPYGYGGPLFNILNDKGVKESILIFFKEYSIYCKKNNYISEFIRFHPLLKNHKLLTDISEIQLQYLNDVVAIDLTKDKPDIFSNFKKNKRYQIRKSEKMECKVIIDENPQLSDIKSFIDLYYQTMDKNTASNKYYFSEKFILNHFEMLHGRIIVAKAILASEIVGMSLFIFGNEYIHYHLSGSKKIKGLYPSDMILWYIVKWAKTQNNKCFNWFHLGGGRGTNDSLFKFKSGFSQHTFPFYLGKIIFCPKEYEKLSKKNPNCEENETFFPPYRKGFDENII